MKQQLHSKIKLVGTAEVPSAALFRRIIGKLRAQDYSADVARDVTALIRIFGRLANHLTFGLIVMGIIIENAVLLLRHLEDIKKGASWHAWARQRES